MVFNMGTVIWKVNQAKKEQDVRLSKVADLEELDACGAESCLRLTVRPESILLAAIQAGDTRQQSQDKDVHTHFRFLWETYKAGENLQDSLARVLEVILDVLKSNSRLEEAKM